MGDFCGSKSMSECILEAPAPQCWIIQRISGSGRHTVGRGCNDDISKSRSRNVTIMLDLAMCVVREMISRPEAHAAPAGWHDCGRCQTWETILVDSANCEWRNRNECVDQRRGSLVPLSTAAGSEEPEEPEKLLGAKGLLEESGVKA